MLVKNILGEEIAKQFPDRGVKARPQQALVCQTGKRYEKVLWVFRAIFVDETVQILLLGECQTGAGYEKVLYVFIAIFFDETVPIVVVKTFLAGRLLSSSRTEMSKRDHSKLWYKSAFVPKLGL